MKYIYHIEQTIHDLDLYCMLFSLEAIVLPNAMTDPLLPPTGQAALFGGVPWRGPRGVRHAAPHLPPPEAHPRLLLLRPRTQEPPPEGTCGLGEAPHPRLVLRGRPTGRQEEVPRDRQQQDLRVLAHPCTVQGRRGPRGAVPGPHPGGGGGGEGAAAAHGRSRDQWRHR